MGTGWCFRLGGGRMRHSKSKNNERVYKHVVSILKVV
jgi:hypothetical protein